MADEDTRLMPAAGQAALRSRAVRAVLEGMTQAEAARVFGVHHNAVNRWIKRCREVGWAGLSAQRWPLEQNPTAVARPLAEEFPGIRAQARREGGLVSITRRVVAAVLRNGTTRLQA